MVRQFDAGLLGVLAIVPADADDFVSAGTVVKKGQTLLIVEAMKVMNPITAPADGTVSQVLVQNAQPVEFGEALVIIE